MINTATPEQFSNCLRKFNVYSIASISASKHTRKLIVIRNLFDINKLHFNYGKCNNIVGFDLFNMLHI